MTSAPAITFDARFNKLDYDVLESAGRIAQIDEALTAKGQEIINELMETCSIGHTNEQKIFERLNELEAEEIELQNKYYTEFDSYSTTKRDWIKRIVACLRDTDGTSPNNTPLRFAQSVTNSNLLKKLLDNPPITEVKEKIENFGPFDLQFSEILILPAKRLGEGAYGEVNEGYCRGVLVAVKTLKITVETTNFENFKRECMIMKTAAHTNILLFMGACQQPPDRYYLVTELAPRGSLDRYLHQEDDEKKSTVFTKLNFFQKMNICRQVARGMTWLHSQDILHLDLKPANLLLMEDWTVKIADFGLSRLKPNKDQQEGTGGSVGGTILYMPPEALGSKPQITTKCDVYAYSMILWEVATERFPHDRKYPSYYALIQAVCRGERPAIDVSTSSKITPSLATLIQQCWNSDPQMRPSFDKILAQAQANTDIFDTIFAECVAGRDKDLDGRIAYMWSSFGSAANAVPWETFEVAFSKLMNTKPKDPNMSSLKALLNVIENDNKVTSNNFNHFVQTFAPLEPVGGAKTSTLEAVSQIVKEKWFWGECNGEEAVDILRNVRNGTYLVRFSAGAIGVFTLSYRNQNKVIHKRLSCTPTALKGYIKKEKKTLKLHKPPAGRPAKFVTAINNVSSANYVGGYRVMGVNYAI